MIIKFKLFENYSEIYDMKMGLVDSLDNSVIDDLWNDICKKDARYICENLPSYIWNHIDDAKFMVDHIADQIENSSIESFDNKSDYIDYLESNMTEDKESEIIKMLGVDEYENEFLNQLTENQLREIIEDAGEEDEYVENRVENTNSNETAESVLTGMYGNDYDGFYNIVSNYINDSEFEEKYESEAHKEGDLAEELESSTELQKSILEADDENALDLAKIFAKDDGGNDNIGDEYDFQKAYLDNSEDKRQAALFLSKHFDLDSDIKQEYSKYMGEVFANDLNM